LHVASAFSKRFYAAVRASILVRNAKWIAIGLCILFVLGAYAVWSYAYGMFNPNPSCAIATYTQVCPRVGECDGFQIGSANLTVYQAEDIQRQTLSLEISAFGNESMTSVSVCVNDAPLGSVSGPFTPGVPRLVTLGVPTTLSISQGQEYTVAAEGVFPSAEAGGPSSEYFQSVLVQAQ
jgi:hypothetical protein